MERRTKVLVLFYSFTGKTAELARHMAEGSAALENTDVEIKQVPELISENELADNPEIRKIREKLNREFPVATPQDLVNADAIAFGTPTHFGSVASQMKHFIDQLTPAWLGRKLVNKPAAFFTSAGGIHSGGEATLISFMIPALNLGMIPVGIPYPIRGEGTDFDSGSPYGVIFVSGNNRELSEGDKKVARILGKRLSAMAKIMTCDNEVCKRCLTLLETLEE